MHETKETNSDQTTTVQERTRRHQRKQHTRCIVFGESVLRSLIENDKQNKIVRVYCVCIIEDVSSHTVLTRRMIEKKLTFDTVLL